MARVSTAPATQPPGTRTVRIPTVSVPVCSPHTRLLPTSCLQPMASTSDLTEGQRAEGLGRVVGTLVPELQPRARSLSRVLPLAVTPASSD